MQKMGNLKPGAEYVYEQQDGITYAREKNASINSRVEIGWEYDTRTSDGRPLHDHIMDDKLWGDIRRSAKTNSTLHKALSHAILIYHLSKDHGKK
jgi:hypothetical protein